MNISIMGFGGTGKTAVSRLLARTLGKRLVSTDEEIAKKAKLSVDRLVKKYGWDKALEIESEVIDELSSLDECIFDTGSVAVLRNENIINLKRNGLIVFLTCDQKVIEMRIRKGQEKADIIKNNYIDKMKGILDECQDKYKRASDYTIDTSGLSPEEVCDIIAHYVQMELH